MSYLYSRALVEAFSAESCSDGEPSAPLKSIPIARAFLCSDKTTVFSRLSQYGMMLQPLTAIRGEVLLTSFRAAFHAKTYPVLEREPELKVNDPAFGVNLRELSVKFDRDSCLWKTHHCLFHEDLAPSSVILPRWGIMQDGELWERTMPERFTGENESGLWPTPSASDWKDSKEDGFTPLGRAFKPHPKRGDSINPRVKKKEAGGALNPTWVELLMGWPEDWTCINPITSLYYNEWLMGFNQGVFNGTKKRNKKAVPDLQEDNATEALREEAGGLGGLDTEKILLPILCQHSENINKIGIQLQGKKTHQNGLRSLRGNKKITGAPYRSKYNKQLPGEYPNPLQMVPRFSPSYGTEAWQDGSWENGVNRVAIGVKYRVDRLKAIGNGQVPAVARLAWNIISERK